MKSNVGHKEKRTCCGCGACAGICPKSCIQMNIDREGFSYPSVDESLCIECGLCIKTCPWEHNEKKVPRHAYALKAKDSDVQYKSSSGGAFYVIASHLITKGYIVYGAAYSEDFSKIIHIRINQCSELPLLRGSKYVQSSLSESFNEIRSLLEAGERVLFSGTGCQVAALKSFLKRDYENLITIDILCHGVPSPLLYKHYIDNVRKKYGEISFINMKDKTNGWKHQQLKIVAKKDVPTDIQDLWYRIFYSRVALRPSCYDCLFMDIARPGDISLGDYWGIEHVSHEFLDKDGVSLMLSNTEKGCSVFNAVRDNFKWLETTTEECMQPVLRGAEGAPEWRNSFWDTYHELGFKETIFRFWNVSFDNKYIHTLKRILNRITRF